MLYTRFGQTRVAQDWQCAYCSKIQTPKDIVYFQFTDPIDYEDQRIAEEEFSMMCWLCWQVIEKTVKKFDIPTQEPMEFLWGTKGIIKDGSGRRKAERSSAVDSSNNRAEDSLSPLSGSSEDS